MTAPRRSSEGSGADAPLGAVFVRGVSVAVILLSPGCALESGELAPEELPEVVASVSETGRGLVKTDEIRRMPVNKQILFVENLDPLFTEKLFYVEDSEFTSEENKSALFDENPVHQ